MRAGWIFRWLWRLNAVIIALAGTLAAAVMLFAAYHIVDDLTRTRHASGIVNVDSEDSVAETWSYGSLRQVHGADIAVLALQSRQSFSLNLGSGSKETVATRNLLFIDTQTGSHRWLLDDNDSLIAHHEFLPGDDAEFESQSVALIVYEVVTADTDGDGRLDNGDKQTLMISRADGTANTELLRNVDGINGYVLRLPDVLLVAYEDGGIVHLATVRIADFTIDTDASVAPPATRS